MTPQKILVTGGAGFIGSHVVDAFVEAGHEVSVIDNLSTGNIDYVNRQAKFFQADITDRAAMKQLILSIRPDAIDHHAAHIQVGNSVQDPQFDATANILGVLNIMEAAKEVGVKRVLMASTGGAMYGNKQTPFTEEMKAEPLSPYGVSKRSGELYLNYYHEQYGISFTSLRYANVYGPRQNPHGESGVVAIFSEMIAAGKAPIINGDGSHTRDYVHVTDVARANLLALESDFVGELNIGTAREISTLEVFRTVVKEFGAQIPETFGPERPGEQVTSALSPAKAKEILVWEPSISFEDGVREVAGWYKKRNAVE
jgi:UDP-glucose 4-epimerase